jgi:methyl-accepting chemotaxis protein
LLRSILANVEETSGVVREVSTASREQSSGVEQIAQAMAQMDQVTQTNAANAEENASASEELSSQAAGQAAIVSVLSGIVLGSGNGRTPGAQAGPRGRGAGYGRPLAPLSSAPPSGRAAQGGPAGGLRAQIEGSRDSREGTRAEKKAGPDPRFRDIRA